MSSAALSKRYSPEEYLALERKAEHKSEYYNGAIYAMSGASREHNLLAMNLSVAIHPQLKGRPCEVYASGMRVRVRSTTLYTYPDVVIACDNPRFEDQEFDTLLNPVVLFEILSPSTEAYDRGMKFANYRSIESLREYVLVSQSVRRIEQYVRQGDTWLLTDYGDLDDVVELASVGCKIAVRDVYDRVDVPRWEPIDQPRK